MLRKIAIGLCAALLLVGCGPGDNSSQTVSKPTADGAQLFNYSHTLALVMRRAAVPARFEAARNACVNDAKLGCTLVQATLNTTGEDGATTAELDVALPHDSVAVFEKKLIEALPEDGSTAVSVTSRNTRAENLTGQAADLDRKIAQLTTYRDRLAELAKRENAGVDDLIKVEGELSRVQTELDEATAQKRDVSVRVTKENLHVSLSENRAVAGPVLRVWRHGGETIADSSAIVLSLVIAFTPWVALIGVIVLIVLGIRRLFVRRPAG